MPSSGEYPKTKASALSISVTSTSPAADENACVLAQFRHTF
jgi:hypothetical protein